MPIEYLSLRYFIKCKNCISFTTVQKKGIGFELVLNLFPILAKIPELFQMHVQNWNFDNICFIFEQESDILSIECCRFQEK